MIILQIIWTILVAVDIAILIALPILLVHEHVVEPIMQARRRQHNWERRMGVAE